MKTIFYFSYFIGLIAVVVAVESINLCCHLLFGKKPIEVFEL